MVGILLSGMLSFQVFAQNDLGVTKFNQSTSDEFVPGQVVVGLERADPNFHASVVARGGQVINTIDQINAHVIKVPVNSEDVFISSISHNPNVKYAERDVIMRETSVTNDPLFPFQWGMKRIGMESAWDKNLGSGVIVAVIDGGLYDNHPDLKGRIITDPDLVFDFVDNDDNARPSKICDERPDWHSTFVSGIIAATRNNFPVPEGVAGVGPVDILPVRVLNCGSGSSSNVALGILHATDKGADVINLSLGSKIASSAILDAVNTAHTNGAIIVASAGNEGNPGPHYPSDFDNVISVSATNKLDELASYSSFGKNIELAAPGGEAEPTCLPDTTYIVSTGAIFNDDTEKVEFTYLCAVGTSFSAPLVSGVAALLRDQYPDKDLDGNYIVSNEDIRSHLKLTAQNIGDAKFFGSGLVRADVAVSAPIGAPPDPDIIKPTVSSVSSSTPNGSYKEGDTITVTVTFSEVVTVDTTLGTPTITLETGTTDRDATFSSGSGTGTLSFTYSVQPGDTSSDLEYTNTDALSANSDTIQDSAGNDAILSLPTIGGGASLSDNKNIIIDTTPPTITAPADITVEGNVLGGVAFNDAAVTAFLAGASATDIVDGATAVTNDALTSGVYGVTIHTITFSSTDSSGNTGTATAKITVTDITPPTITAPADITVERNTSGGHDGTELGTATASDIVDPAPVITDNIASLVTLPLGPTTVTYTATDASGNSASATQLVTVVDTTAPTVSVSHLPTSPTSSQTITFTATASDPSGINSISIYVDDLITHKKTCNAVLTCEFVGGPYPDTSSHNYYATAEDGVGNIGRDPNAGTKSFTVNDAVSGTLEVKSIEMSGDTKRGGGSCKAMAAVTIIEAGNLVADALVEGTWTLPQGDPPESVSGTTNGKGKITFRTGWVNCGTFEFSVDKVNGVPLDTTDPKNSAVYP